MREQVCKYMCPYARFQSAMFDRDTMIITYDRARGEPRGGRSKKIDPQALSLGDCVDCGICVQACPTGIDIRNGLQYECIGCAACIDGCDQVMDRMGYPRGLIRYSTTNAMAEGLTRREMLARAARPRVLIYSLILIVVMVATAATLWLRVPLKVDVIRDRGAMARDVGEGEVENVYRLQIMNTAEERRSFELDVEGLEDIHIAGPNVIELAGATSMMAPVKVRVHVEREHTLPGAHPIYFKVRAIGNPRVAVREKSVFIVR